MGWFSRHSADPSARVDRALVARLRTFEPEIRRALQGRFPELAPDVSLVFQRIRHDGTHAIVVVRTVRPVRSMIIKAPRSTGRTLVPGEERTLMERAETEYHVLTEITPQISAEQPAARCPEVFGFYPDVPYLFLEMVRGENLKSFLFGIGCARHHERVASVLQLSAEWLARFHAVTRSGHELNPFDWILAELEIPLVRRVLETYAGEDAYRGIRSHAVQSRRHYPEFRRPLCRIHGGFTPYHVLASEGGIYVIDLESSRLGYPDEDLALFTACYEMFAPWRRLLGAWRMNLEGQLSLFLGTYAKRTEPVTGPDLLLRRFTRLLGMARFVCLCLSGRPGNDFLAAVGVFSGRTPAAPVTSDVPRRSLRLRVLESWWRHRFHVVGQQELLALREAARSYNRVDQVPTSPPSQ